MSKLQLDYNEEMNDSDSDELGKLFVTKLLAPIQQPPIQPTQQQEVEKKPT